MSEPRLAERVKSFRRIAVGYLAGYNLTFDKASKDDSGKCDCERTGAAHHRVYGLVFALNTGAQDALDKAEGAGRGYDRHTVTILTDNGIITAVTYFATNKKPGLRPYHWYKKHVLLGARPAQLPPEYISTIESIESIEDDNLARVKEQLAIYSSVDQCVRTSSQ